MSNIQLVCPISDALLTIDELCDYLKIGKCAAYELARSKKVESFKLCGRWRVTGSSVIAYLHTLINQ